MDSGLHCPADTPTFNFIGLCDMLMEADANAIELSLQTNLQIFSFFPFTTRALHILICSVYCLKLQALMTDVFSPKGNFLGQHNLFLFAPCMNDSWPVTFPKGSGWGLSVLGLGWGSDGRWAGGRKCKPIHIRPHLDLARQLFMHDSNKRAALHIHLVGPQSIDH